MSSTRGTRILLVEDDSSIAKVYQLYMEKEGYSVTHAALGRQALMLLHEDNPPPIVLLDIQLPDIDGFEILRTISEHNLPTNVVIVTGQGSLNTAVEAMRAGASDFLVKPIDQNRLILTLNNICETQRLRKLVEIYREEIDRTNFCGFIGSSLAMQAVYKTIESTAKSKATVFVTGESGTGKELCAEAIHDMSDRRGKPFVAINCGAIPKDLIESEIFGHIKGAYTGATTDRVGAAGRATGGTLFLDEICEMDLEFQSKILRFIQTGTVQRLGASHQESVDIRIVCATNRSPWEEVLAGRFREDLYYRLHVIPIELPPLRDRDDDSVKIAEYFLEKYRGEEGKQFRAFSQASESLIASYPWPGNVRQLQNVIRNIVVLHDAEIVEPDMFPAPLDRVGTQHTQPTSQPHVNTTKPYITSENSTSNIIPLSEVERRAIENAISICDGNIPEAALRLGTSAATIYRKKITWADKKSDS